jgi:hypothetical protein
MRRSPSRAQSWKELIAEVLPAAQMSLLFIRQCQARW